MNDENNQIESEVAQGGAVGKQWESLLNDARAVDALEGDTASAPELSHGQDDAIGVRQAVDLLGAVVVGALPEAAPVWSGAAKGALVDSIMPVAKKYGWDTSSIPPELVLVATAGSMAYATWGIYKAKKEGLKDGESKENATA